MAETAQAEQKGLYCSTAGSYFTDKDALADHYKSEFHRYFTLANRTVYCCRYKKASSICVVNSAFRVSAALEASEYYERWDGVAGTI